MVPLISAKICIYRNKSIDPFSTHNLWIDWHQWCDLRYIKVLTTVWQSLFWWNLKLWNTGLTLEHLAILEINKNNSRFGNNFSPFPNVISSLQSLHSPLLSDLHFLNFDKACDMSSKICRCHTHSKAQSTPYSHPTVYTYSLYKTVFWSLILMSKTNNLKNKKLFYYFHIKPYIWKQYDNIHDTVEAVSILLKYEIKKYQPKNNDDLYIKH